MGGPLVAVTHKRMQGGLNIVDTATTRSKIFAWKVGLARYLQNDSVLFSVKELFKQAWSSGQRLTGKQPRRKDPATEGPYGVSHLTFRKPRATRRIS